ncbi:gephyrin isoform X1 [Microplitis mediator]|uniref:gephyrin isoform X1 n=2 Tax=Microplitis mediator TaxID=375433 RepID=UPI0025522F34|nr:gephyrin isoform X1 [Microplitis mediator]
MAITFGILTISDTCADDPAKDKSGLTLKTLIEGTDNDPGFPLRGQILEYKIVSDNEDKIMKILKQWADKMKMNVILTTGGTGFSARDNTPEATKKIIEKEAPGLSIAMLNASLKITPLAVLSRAVCGIRKETLIINLPGSPKAAKENLNAIASTIPHAVDLILNNKFNVIKTHEEVQRGIFKHECPHEKYSNDSFQVENVANRLRKSPWPMISMEEVSEIFNNFNWNNETETLELWKCHGRILSQDILSLCNLPPFPASIKDGYAVIASDGEGLRQVLGGLEAGHTPGLVKLSNGFCVRINTGAPVPDEATAVVQVEDTRLVTKNEFGEETEIEIMVGPIEGQDIRPIGSDVQKDELVLRKFTRIGAAELGILASCGYSKVKVTKVPVIGILSTGNELQTAGETLKPGYVYDSNKITLMMLLKEYGYDATDLGIARDEESIMINVMRDAFERVDVLITTGSVSMGDRDLLKPILTKVFNAKIHFGRVNMKPGKPTTFATCVYNNMNKYIVCLPGNPVSATVTAHLFAIPLINRLSGNYSKPTIVQTRLTSSYKLDLRPEYARVILQWTDPDKIPVAHSTGNQISSKLLSCKNANALLILPGRTDERKEIKEGDTVPAMLLGFSQIEI